MSWWLFLALVASWERGSGFRRRRPEDDVDSKALRLPEDVDCQVGSVRKGYAARFQHLKLLEVVGRALKRRFDRDKNKPTMSETQKQCLRLDTVLLIPSITFQSMPHTVLSSFVV